MASQNFTLTKELLHEYFEYRDGILYSKKRRGYSKVGNKNGCKNFDGYIMIGFLKNRLYAHRMIFLMHHGYLPETVDHIDCNKENNKIENLRAATLAQNNLNMPLNKRNTSGVKGVSWNKQNKNWRVTVKVNNKSTYFGSFKNIEDAKIVAEKVREKHFKEFARHE